MNATLLLVEFPPTLAWRGFGEPIAGVMRPKGPATLPLLMPVMMIIIILTMEVSNGWSWRLEVIRRINGWNVRPE